MADVKELNINNTTYDIKAKSVVDNNSGAVKFWTGTKAQYNAIVTKDSNTQYNCTDSGEIYLGTDLIANKAGNRNIGEIVASTIPLTDAGLHLLDGSLILGNGIYSAFIDYIANLYNSGDYTAIFETEANWQTAVTTYGVCGKFVYDSVNNTVRLPKYSNKIYTKDFASTAPVKGNGMVLGLTNGTDNRGLAASNAAAYVNAAAYGANVSSRSVSGSSGNGYFGVTTDATKSGIIADFSNITTSLDGYYYIVIATTAKAAIEVDIDEVVTDLNGKADVDLTNLTASQSTNFDGRWIAINGDNNVVSISSFESSTSFDLSSVLPSDNYNYEILLCVQGWTKVSSGATMFIKCRTDWLNSSYKNTPIARVTYYSGMGGDGAAFANTITVPIGTSRTLYLNLEAGKAQWFNFWIAGYRRIGTNQ